METPPYEGGGQARMSIDKNTDPRFSPKRSVRSTQSRFRHRLAFQQVNLNGNDDGTPISSRTRRLARSTNVNFGLINKHKMGGEISHDESTGSAAKRSKRLSSKAHKSSQRFASPLPPEYNMPTADLSNKDQAEFMGLFKTTKQRKRKQSSSMNSSGMEKELMDKSSMDISREKLPQDLLDLNDSFKELDDYDLIIQPVSRE